MDWSDTGDMRKVSLPSLWFSSLHWAYHRVLCRQSGKIAIYNRIPLLFFPKLVVTIRQNPLKMAEYSFFGVLADAIERARKDYQKKTSMPSIQGLLCLLYARSIFAICLHNGVFAFFYKGMLEKVTMQKKTQQFSAFPLLPKEASK